MSQDLPIPRQDRPDGTTIVEWGDADPAPPGRPGRSVAGLARDHRLPPVLVGLGAVATTASLVGEWLVMTVPNGGPDGNTPIRVPVGVADVGGFGVGYLVGLLGLAVAVALALRGTAAARQNARVAGLGLAAAVLALLTAAAFSLDDSGRRTLFYSSEDGFRVDYGRGLVSAFAAVALLAGACYLSGRAVQPAAEPDGEPGTAESGRPAPSRRRSREDELPPAPADLTVTPTVPFARPDQPR
ncbi:MULTISPECIES: hypothetical protein [Micromonospora]|uniref:Tryptophan-associated transmembrane protein (Trp_oprn_chp) n=1 Tax=Micromonospora solifontis TaxID=2487138 RepID=A0ABX9WIY9_9ACTN|nr:MULTISPECIES: hypothetical protein [Micromonospora]NES16375.1 hypothetical protein [Micromonospora sp. PPF5-17B]NES36225.1 hypothetical protein [Micromonospora solifontis]NES57976.1 hypothetical protein [Micromonospora sp. PPF5-6]RNL99813.1 hypothetical protein EFE23_08605 [Micromonospora solifontis]